MSPERCVIHFDDRVVEQVGNQKDVFRVARFGFPVQLTECIIDRRAALSGKDVVS